MKKTQRGITLIALIISIVVLLILAVVTVGSVKESGIIDKAQQAARQSEIAQIKEAFELKQTEKLLLNTIDKNANTQISSLDDLDISDNLKDKYRDKLVISGGKLYYDPEVVTDNEERAYMEKQGITALPQQNPDGSDPEGSDPNEPDPNDSTFKVAVKTAVRNTTKTGDYYNLITIMNTVKQNPSYSSIVGLVLKDDFNGDAANPITEETFGYIVDENTTILLKNGDEEIEVSSTGNITDYNGNVVLMYDLDVMNEFGLKRISEGELEVVSYKGSNPNIVVPTAIFDDNGIITASIQDISSSAFVKNTSQPSPIPVSTLGMPNEFFKNQPLSTVFSGLGIPVVPSGFDGTETSVEDKLRALYETFLSGVLGANTTASLIFDEEGIPSMFATIDGAEISFVKRTTNIDITTVTLPVCINEIGSEAFKDQTTLTSVTLPVGARPKIGTSAFSGCTNLARIDFNVANSSVSSSEITAISGFSTRWGAPTDTKIYFNGTALN